MKKLKKGFILFKIRQTLILITSTVLILSCLQAGAQAPSEKGLPFITNYSTKLSDNSQVWSIQEDERRYYIFRS